MDHQVADAIAKKRLQLMNNKNTVNFVKKFFEFLRQAQLPSYDNFREDVMSLSNHLDRMGLMLQRYQRKNIRICYEISKFRSFSLNILSLFSQVFT